MGIAVWQMGFSEWLLCRRLLYIDSKHKRVSCEMSCSKKNVVQISSKPRLTSAWVAMTRKVTYVPFADHATGPGVRGYDYFTADGAREAPADKKRGRANCVATLLPIQSCRTHAVHQHAPGNGSLTLPMLLLGTKLGY
jgi:hypothetical protein